MTGHHGLVRACALLLVAVAGCNQVFHLRETRLSDATPPDAAPIAAVKVFVAQDIAGLSPQTFHTAGAAAAGDAIVLLVGCNAYPSKPTGVSVTAPGWSFEQLTTFTSGGSEYWAAAFGAIAPDAMPADLTVTWTTAVCQEVFAIGDEFAVTAPGGGAMTFEARAINSADTGDCTAMLTTEHANDAIWAACYSGSYVIAVPPPYTQSGNTTGGELSGYRITTDPGGTVEDVTFTNTPNSPFVMTAVALVPAGP